MVAKIGIKYIRIFFKHLKMILCKNAGARVMLSQKKIDISQDNFWVQILKMSAPLGTNNDIIICSEKNSKMI